MDRKAAFLALPVAAGILLVVWLAADAFWTGAVAPEPPDRVAPESVPTGSGEREDLVGHAPGPPSGTPRADDGPDGSRPGGNARDPGATLDSLIAALGRAATPEARRDILGRIAALGTPRAVEALLAAYRSAGPEGGAGALAAIESVRSPEAEPALLDVFDPEGDDDDLAAAAGVALARSGGREGARRLVDHLVVHHEFDFRYHHRIREALLEEPSDALIELSRDALADPSADPVLLTLAAEALGARGDLPSIELLLARQGAETDPERRRDVLRGISRGRAKGPEALEALRRTFTAAPEEDAELRSALAEAIRRGS